MLSTETETTMPKNYAAAKGRPPGHNKVKPMTRDELSNLCDVALLPRWIRTGFQQIKRIERTYEDRVVDKDGHVTRPMITTVGIEIQHDALEVGVFSDSDFDYHRGSPSSELLMLSLRYFMFKSTAGRWVRGTVIEQGMLTYQKLCAVAEREFNVKVQQPFISSQFNPKDVK